MKILAPAVKVFVTALLLFLVFWAVDPSKIKRDLAQLEAGHLAFLVLVSWFGQLFCAQRWRLFASSLGMDASYWTFFQMYFAGMFFNVGLPSLVGGDVIKAYMISRRTHAALSFGFASVLQDRAAGLISLLVYGSAAVLIHPMNWKGIPLGLIYLVTWAGIGLLVGLVWMGNGSYGRYLSTGSQSFLHRVFSLLRDFHEALGTMRLTPGATLQITAVSFFNSALVLWMFQQVSVAAGHPISLVAFSVLFPLISLLTMVPISVAGIGIREWAYVEALALLQVPPDRALAIALTSSALLIVADLVGVFFLPTIPTELRTKT